MLDGNSAVSHPVLSFWLDVLDKAIKFAAVALGGIWTYWNYKKSRTYEQKMELQLIGSTFERGSTYIEVLARLKNLGETKHSVEQTGTYCKLTAILPDLSEEEVDAWPIFTQDEYIEPGETITDRICTRLLLDPSRIIWIRVDLRVASAGVEWHQSDTIRMVVETQSTAREPNQRS